MKTKHILISALILNFFFFTSCSKDDDSIDNNGQQQTVLEKLTSGKWYNESRTPGTDYTDCEKNGYIEFKVDGGFNLESFDDSSGPCESLGLNMATFTLSNNRDILITFGSEEISSVIDTITQELLVVTSSNGETITFDKTQG